jgi:hypothetical protein
MRRLDSRLAASQEELFQSRVAEGLNHDMNVARSASRVKHKVVAIQILETRYGPKWP